MRLTLTIPRDPALYTDALEGLARINERLYREAARRGRPLRSIYAGGVRYVREYPGEEDWKHVGRVLSDGEGDCEDLVAARVGELRANGEAQARPNVRRVSPTMTHAEVIRANGIVEDPSRRLGMAAPRRPTPPPRMAQRSPMALARQLATRPQMRAQLAQLSRPSFAERAAATLAPQPMAAPSTASSIPPILRSLGKAPMYEPDAPDLDDFDEDIDTDEGEEGDSDEVGADVSQSMELSWSVDRTPTGWKGTIRVPLDAGRALLVTRNVQGNSESAKKQAVGKGLSAASKVLDNPAVAALLPPQAKLALQIARSKTARNVAKKISSWF